MRPVNLLPDGQGPRRSPAARSGRAYAAVGLLAAFLLGAVLYVLTANGVTSRQDELARLKSETAAAQQRIDSLGAFATFAQVKATRLRSVQALATERFDWERTVRELSRVIPSNVRLEAVEAGAGEQAPGSTPASAAASGGPELKLKGCAPRQSDVATTMVRLRRLYRSQDVMLEDSAKAGGSGGGSGAAAPAVAGGASCPSTRYAFNVTVAFGPGGPSQAGPKTPVPAALGGGA